MSSIRKSGGGTGSPARNLRHSFFCRFRIALLQPVDGHAFALHFAEKDVLPLGELADAVEEQRPHFRFLCLPLQETRDLAVFEAESFEFLP